MQLILKLRSIFLRHRQPQPILPILFIPFGLLTHKDFSITWHSNLLATRVHDKGYSRNASCALNTLYAVVIWTEVIYFVIWRQLNTNKENLTLCLGTYRVTFDCTHLARTANEFNQYLKTCYTYPPNKWFWHSICLLLVYWNNQEVINLHIIQYKV